jgi:uncharacterized protein YecT (DUF1311 family)
MAVAIEEAKARDKGWTAMSNTRDRNWKVAICAGAITLSLLSACGSPSTNSIASTAQPPPTNTKPAEPKAPSSTWIGAASTSGIDGQTITRTKTFKVADGGSSVVVKLICLVESKHLTATIESYGADGSSPSSFVSKPHPEYVNFAHPENGVPQRPVGRMKAAGKMADLSEAFGNDKYSNVISWDLSKTANKILLDQYTDRSNQVENAFGRLHPAGSMDEDPIAIENWQREQNELAPAKFERAKKIYTGGNLLQTILPIFIEASNQQGTFELQIPSDDAGLNDFVKQCSGAGVDAAQLDTIFAFDAIKPTRPPRGDAQAQAMPTPSSNQSDPTPAIPSVQSTPAAQGAQVAPSGEAQKAVNASFDCAKAGTAVEKLICADPGLRAADGEMATIYKRVYAAAGSGAEAVKQDQREFIAKRNQCGTAECIAGAYQSRRVALAQMSP